MKKTVRFYDSERFFQCPFCKQELKLVQNSLQCANHHCFDISKLGYVNLAPNAKQPKHYSKATFENRMDVLEKGYYSHILDELVRILGELESAASILDVGCGEGYYSRKIKEKLDKEVIAFDISKDSIQLAAKKDSSNAIRWFVGDLAKLPVRSRSIDCILNVFSPANYSEFNRVLTEKGHVIKVIPGNNHLKEFRNIAKEYLNNREYSNRDVAEYFKKQYSVVYHKKAAVTYAMLPEEITAFANMTPLLFQVDKSRIDLEGIRELTIDAEVILCQPQLHTWP